MKALVMTAVKKLEVENDYQKPEIKPNEVLVHTAWAVAGPTRPSTMVCQALPTPFHRLF